MKIILNLTGLFFLCITAYGQESPVTSGGEAAGNDGAVSYSVGQVLNAVDSSLDGSIIQGVQQPYEIYTSSVDESLPVKIQLSIYPNPTRDMLHLRVEDTEHFTLTYQLRDIKGRLLNTKAIKGSLTQIDLAHLDASTYFLKVLGQDQEYKTFKIVKH